MTSVSPKRAAAELEAVLAKSFFLTTIEGSDFEGSASVNGSVMSRDSGALLEPERFILASRSAHPRHLLLQRSQSSSSMSDIDDDVLPRPDIMARSKSLGSCTDKEIQQISKSIRARSLMDDDSATVTSSGAASSAKDSSAGTKERFTFIANIGDMQKDRSYDTAKSVGSRKSRRSKQSKRSSRSRKRGDSLEREISLMILQTAEHGADSAHFLVSQEPEIKPQCKSAEDILGDLFVSQDTSLEPITLKEGTTEFRAFYADDDKPISPGSLTFLPADEQPLSPSLDVSPLDTTNELPSPLTDVALIETKSSKDSGSIFIFQPDAEKNNVVEDEDLHAPTYAKKYIKQDRKVTAAAIVSEAPSEDSLFFFSGTSNNTQDTSRGSEVLFPERSLKEEFAFGSRWSPDVNAKQMPAATTKELRLKPGPKFLCNSADAFATLNDQEMLRTNSSLDQSTDRYKIELESSTSGTSIEVSRSFVSATDGASEVQHVLAMVASPTASDSGALNLEREDSFVDESASQEERVAQEELFLDKLVDIVKVARERPRDLQLADYYKSESGETESITTVEYLEDELSREQTFESEEKPRPMVPRVDSLENLGDHPDPELDDFLEHVGFGDSDDEDESSDERVDGVSDFDEEESSGERADDDEWTAFDSSPFGKSRFENDEASGSTAPPPENGKHSPESPTSITDFSTKDSSREKAKVIWLANKGQVEPDDMSSI
eukprot:CAMPEP_0202497596 /NCGR_PEP_ID=MMETSP1361-20130828/23294_1 /ASSEMBLY_ACC=CAM_ASM_000849 /TAXON_ID=210615 /ORGANISM="Staurosira complex sp., Strain CCMP2646" /LENGTH=720 /DNA_ID=CAMNT_0049129245 /DNA_START=30 /DNA_END=2192 /DNA_ORIENTATION=-